jgi:hypothetical protein
MTTVPQAKLEALADVGVAFVIVDTFESARAHGATRWLSTSKALLMNSESRLYLVGEGTERLPRGAPPNNSVHYFPSHLLTFA